MTTTNDARKLLAARHRRSDMYTAEQLERMRTQALDQKLVTLHISQLDLRNIITVLEMYSGRSNEYLLRTLREQVRG